MNFKGNAIKVQITTELGLFQRPDPLDSEFMQTLSISKGGTVCWNRYFTDGDFGKHKIERHRYKIFDRKAEVDYVDQITRFFQNNSEEIAACDAGICIVKITMEDGTKYETDLPYDIDTPAPLLAASINIRRELNNKDIWMFGNIEEYQE